MPAESSTTNGAKKLECDLVMKGGITSGIVYPPLVIALRASQPPARFADQSPMPEPVLRVTPEV